MASPDAGRRRDAARANADHVAALFALGVRTFLAVVTPEDPARDRRENFAYAVDGFGQLCQLIGSIGSAGVRIVLEAHPGHPPYYAALSCTPADCRAFLAAVGSDVLGLNLDPANLLRAGIDPLRFVREFGPRIGHVHAKDVVLNADGLYEHGNLQPPTFAAPLPPYTGGHWRYAIPGAGNVPWPELLQALANAGYLGGLSVELEDIDYLGTPANEQRGLLAARNFLLNL